MELKILRTTNHELPTDVAKQHHDVIIIGGGAAGLFCAFQAALRGRRVLLLEHNDRVGKKIGISGGGRCNFTNIDAGAENYLSENPNFCKSALARYSPWDFIALVEKHGIAYHEKKLGQQFCDGSSREIIDMLLRECHDAGVTIMTSCRVQEVSKEEMRPLSKFAAGDERQEVDGAQRLSVHEVLDSASTGATQPVAPAVEFGKRSIFHLTTSRGPFTANSLVIATGGLSFEKLGATDFGYRVAKQFGIVVTTLSPALVPLTFVPTDRGFCSSLAGVALPVQVEHDGIKFEEALLFTHRGVSGPAILQVSSTWKRGEELIFDLLPDSTAASLLLEERKSQALLPNILSRYLPRRFAEAWCDRHHFSKSAHQCSDQEFSNFLQLLHRWPFRFTDTEGYPKAEVTRGGVSTTELSSKTMESRKVRGLYFIGEVVDVTGWLGGYNFQWAWASAHAAAEAV